MPQEQRLSLLQQLRVLLDAPAATAGTATATAGASSLRASAAHALGVACLPLAAGSSGEAKPVLAALPDAPGIVAATAGLLQDKDPKVAKKAAAALGYLCFGHAGGGGADAAAGTGTAGAAGVLQPAVAALLDLRTSKGEDLLFSVGEALCFCFGGGQGGLGSWACCWACLRRG